MKPLTEAEQKRGIAVIKHSGDLAVGDKCPRDGCRGILQEDTVVLFNPNHPQKMRGLDALMCDRKKCDFQYVTKKGKEEHAAWTAELKEGEP